MGPVGIQQNTPTPSLQRGKTPTNECPAYDSKQFDGEAPVMLELLGITEYLFIAIALVYSSSAW